PATALHRELPRGARRVPGPERVGRRRERLVGPGRVRRDTPHRPGAGRVGGRGRGEPARCAGGHDGRGGPRVLRAAGSTGAARGRPPQRREPAPHVRAHAGAPRGGAWQRIRYRAGAGPAQLHAGLDSRSEAQVAAAQYRIGTLVGRSPTDVARELEQTGPLPSLPEVTSIGTPDAVVRYRPDVAAAERFAAAQGALVGAAKASYLPRLTIGGSAGYAAPEFNSVGNQGTLRYVVGPVITWPGLNLGRVKAEVDAAQAREDAARAQYGRAVLAATEDIETSLARYRAARSEEH